MLDLFESVQRHTLKYGKRPADILVTDLTRVQRRLLSLLNLGINSNGVASLASMVILVSALWGLGPAARVGASTSRWWPRRPGR